MTRPAAPRAIPERASVLTSGTAVNWPFSIVPVKKIGAVWFSASRRSEKVPWAVFDSVNRPSENVPMSLVYVVNQPRSM